MEEETFETPPEKKQSQSLKSDRSIAHITINGVRVYFFLIRKEKKSCKNCQQLVSPFRHREFTKGKIILFGIFFVLLLPIMIILVFFDCFLDMFANIHYLCPKCRSILD